MNAKLRGLDLLCRDQDPRKFINREIRKLIPGTVDSAVKSEGGQTISWPSANAGADGYIKGLVVNREEKKSVYTM